ncbi:hypothetical protein ZIOFF_045118 [Zingiber officinale]|uniref:65-kDa microtubule-associated protein 6 n=1 Tax=Zingiber officinale TaxID=94328 RepID=A0A8J5FZU3_ZINOF|nr:hypothetical protein ZIOFF_045118 [Zingiber officinale]
MAGLGVLGGVRASISLETTCGTLLQELECSGQQQFAWLLRRNPNAEVLAVRKIWTEIGESEEEKDLMLLELEKECMKVYQTKVDEARIERARLHQSLVAKEAELASLMVSLGEQSLHLKLELALAYDSLPLVSSQVCQSSAVEGFEWTCTPFYLYALLLKLSALSVVGFWCKITSVQNYVVRHCDHAKEGEKSDFLFRSNASWTAYETTSRSSWVAPQNVHQRWAIGNPTSLKEKLGLLTPLLKDLREKKEDRIKQLSDLSSQIEKLNAEIAGFSHHDNASDNAVKIEEHDLSTRKLTEYQAKLRNLQKEKSDRLHKVMEHVNEVHSLCGVLGEDFKLQDAAKTLIELWNLMDSSEEERRPFKVITNMHGSSEVDATCSGVLSIETIKQIETEVERLKQLKVGRMKELVLKKRSELEEICINTHIEPDVSTAPEKICALLDSCMEPMDGNSLHLGLVDPSELLVNIETQITKAKEEFMIRKEIIDRVNKWLLTCEEEDWLEEYNKDANKYSAGRGAHLNLKRAEKARVTISKIPAIMDNLMNKVFAWEDERHTTFLYDGVRLVSILEEYKLKRQQKEEEKRRYREHKKLQNLLLTEKEAVYGSKPTPKRSNSLRKNVNGNGFMTPSPRRISVGSATPELLTPRSHSGRYNSYFKETRRLSTAPLNFVAISKDDAVSSFASAMGSVTGKKAAWLCFVTAFGLELMTSFVFSYSRFALLRLVEIQGRLVVKFTG